MIVSQSAEAATEEAVVSRLLSMLAVWALLQACMVQPARAADSPNTGPTPLPLSAALDNLARPGHRALVESTALQSFRARYPDCASVAVVRYLPPRAPDNPKLVFDAAGEIASGVVTEPVLVEGCGITTQENVLSAVAHGQRSTIPGVPGTTRADPLLVRDTKPYLAMYTATQGPKDCQDQRVMNTRFEDFEGPPNPKAKSQADSGRPFRETWTVSVCGTILDIPVHYIPNEFGTAIDVTIPPRSAPGK